MRMIHLILFVLIAILALLAWIAFSPEPQFATGIAHPDIAGMRIGGDGLAKLGTIGITAYLLQAAVLVLVVLLIAGGIKKRQRTAVFWLSLLTIGALYQWVWWNIWQRHLEFLHTGETTYFLGFATPTAWMVYGIWLCGFGLLLLYVIGYRRFIFSAQDEAAYEQLLTRISHRDDESSLDL